jgi:hypothetical protein
MNRFAWIACLLSLALGPVFAQQKTVQPGASVGMELTVYNVNMALVKDTRMLTLTRGLNDVQFTDVAAQIDPTSVHFKSLTAPASVVVREQNYQYDLVSREKLLEKYLGKPITIKEKNEGAAPTVITGTLMSAQDGIVLKTPEKLVISNPDSLELPSLPEGLIVKPTLNWSVECLRAANHKVEVSYIADGIQWSADYVAVVNTDDTLTDLNGWVTLDNKSGATYDNAKLKLIAGDVRRTRPANQEPEVAYLMMDAAKSAAPQFEEKAFFEYHMYTLARPTTVRDNETKQIELLTAANVPVKKLYFFDGRNQQLDDQNRAKCQVKLELVNSQQNNLGMPLPKGKVRVYKADTDKSLQFVGEDQIDHTPKDEKVRLYLGDAFDVVGEWRQLETRRIADNVWESTIEVKVRNHKQEAVSVTCTEHASGDWEILKESQPSAKKDAQTFEYSLQVPKDGESTVTYTVRVTG